MRRIRIENPQVERTYKTLISSDYSSGVTLTVLNNSSFAADTLIIVGEPTEELTEGKKVNSISGSTTLNLASTLNFAHPKGTSVYRVLWDFVSIERRASSTDVWAEITQSGIQWDNKLGETIYYDSAGIQSHQYRFRFYNSVSATYSEYSPTITGAGFGRQQVGYMIVQVRLTAQDIERKIVTDDEIIRFFNRAQDIIYGNNPRYRFLLVDTYKGSNGIAATANTSVYSLASYTTYGNLHSVRYRYTSGGTDNIYHLQMLPHYEFDALVSNLNQTKDDTATSYKLLPADSSSTNGYIQIYPTTKTTGVGTLFPNYYEKMANLDTVEDETQVPLPEMLEDFAIAQIEKVRGNETKAEMYEKFFFGPSGVQEKFQQLTGIALLDKLDLAQQQIQGQPRQLWRWRGRNAYTRYFSNRGLNRDYIKENYMD